VIAMTWLIAGIASAQATPADPSLMVLEPIGAPDPAVAQAITASLSSVATNAHYHVVVPAAGSVIGALDPAAGTDLLALVQRTGLHRAVAVWVVASSVGYEVQVGLASSDGTSQSLRAAAGATGIVDVAQRLFASLLPTPFIAASGTWGQVAVVGPPPPSVAPSVAPTVPVATTEPAEARRSHRGDLGLVIGGAVTLGAGWIFGILFGALGGYHDTACLIGPCTPRSSWDPAWDNFRATSLVPIIGPWIQLAVKPPSDGDIWPEWLVIDGIIQGAGAVLLFVGIGLFVSGESEPPPVAVVPMVGPGLVGLTAAGRF